MNVTAGNEKVLRVLTFLCALAVGISCVGSLLLFACRQYLEKFPTGNF